MKIDDKYSVYKIKRFASAHTSFSAIIESIRRQLEIKCPFIDRVIMQESKSTDSVYYYATFKDHHETCEFSIRNHPAHESYKGMTFPIQKYNDEEHMYKVIRNALRDFNDDCLAKNADNDDVTPFGEALLQALEDRTE